MATVSSVTDLLWQIAVGMVLTLAAAAIVHSQLEQRELRKEMAEVARHDAESLVVIYILAAENLELQQKLSK